VLPPSTCHESRNIYLSTSADLPCAFYEFISSLSVRFANMEATNEMDRTDQWQAKLCEHCQAIDFNHIMTEYYTTDVHGLHSDTPLFQFGTVDEVNTRASHCTFCDMVAKAYNTVHVQRRPETQWRLCSEPRSVGFLESRRELRVLVAKLKTIQIYDGGGGVFNYHQFEMLPTQQPLPNSSRTGGDLPEEQVQSTLASQWPLARVLPASVDIHRMQQWRDLCHARHGDTCEYPAWLDQGVSPTGFRLLDVQDMCIVPVDTNVPPYAVLSYVWGASDLEHDSYTTQSTNLGERTQAQSLLNVHLPQTLKDATSLLPKIGLRHLWVEALCVLQDDASDKVMQAAQLGIISARAEFTMIAATNLSGSDGLANLRARKPLQNRRTVQLADDLHFTALSSPAYVHLFNNSDTGASPWLRYASSLLRGLTSKRLLIFNEHEISWECLQDFWCEGLALEDSDPRADGDIPVREKRVSSRFEPGTLPSLLFRYSGLRVFPHQNESDYVDILASILRCFAYTTGEVFHWGLPCSRFSSALTWKCSTLPPIKLSPEGYAMPDSNPEQRRRALYPSRGTSGSMTHIGIPSWSWLGWLGAFLGFYNGIKEQLYDEPRWYKISLNGGVLPVSMVSAEETNQPTRAPWHESQDQGFPPGFFEPSPPAAHFVDSGKIGAWVSTGRLRVSKDGSISATTQHQLHKAALHWSAGPNRLQYGADDSGEEEYDFVAVAHDNRCKMCFRHGVRPADKIRSHVHLLWVEWMGGEGRDEAERKGACCVDEEVWMRAKREWKWVVLT
jgi:hypothetical protein